MRNFSAYSVRLMSHALGELAGSRRTMQHHIRNPTPSVDAYLLEDNPVKCHRDPIWNNGTLGFFEDRLLSTRTRRTTRWV